MFFEARTESVTGQLAVAEVTLNRVASNHYPDTICEVVWQRKQFSWTHDGKHDDPTRMSYLDKLVWEDIKLRANDIIDGKAETTESGAIMYHAEYVKPYWTGSYSKVAKVGTHIFYK